ncbi:DUF5777 family beta-barrel protein [Flavobacterium faecale]|uniref:DUF5777 family beta-barrel protein n=1 Tax=Flavobacterium faecale TaxID=1355330 RepID=UPI003AB046A4
MMKNFWLVLLIPFSMFSQNSLLDELGPIKEDNKSIAAFKSLKIVNFESTKLVGKGDLFFVVAHRFDYIKNGFEDFFGIDDAVTQIKFAYGLTEGVTVHVARSGFQKAYDLGLKYRLISQENNGFPLTIVGFNSITINTEMRKEFYPLIEFKHRLTYVSQLLISRKVNEKLSVELAPTFYHENVVRDILDTNNNVIIPNPQDNSQIALGIGGRYKLAKRWSVNMDYGAHLNRASQSNYKNPLSVGVDLETGGHVFQMHFTNARAMHESGFLGQTTGDWTKGEISFGFNLVRVF